MKRFTMGLVSLLSVVVLMSITDGAAKAAPFCNGSLQGSYAWVGHGITASPFSSFNEGETIGMIRADGLGNLIGKAITYLAFVNNSNVRCVSKLTGSYTIGPKGDGTIHIDSTVIDGLCSNGSFDGDIMVRSHGHVDGLKFLGANEMSMFTLDIQQHP